MQKILTILFLFLLASCTGQNKPEAIAQPLQNTSYTEVTNQAGKPKNMIAESYNLMLEKFNPFYGPISLQISKYIRHMFQDKDGAYWFGTNDDGIARMNGDRLVYFSVEQGLGGRAVRGIVQDSLGRVWVATNGGVSVFANEKWTNLTVKEGLLSNDIWSLFMDSKGRIWAGTMGGLCYMDNNLHDSKAFAFQSFDLPLTVENPQSRFNSKLVWSIFEDRSGSLWFGTDGAGVKKYDGKKIESYTVMDGLTNNNVLSIVQDRSMNIWFSTWGGGLSRFDGKSFTSFTKNEGLSNDNVWSSMLDKEGNLWFGTLGGGVNKYDGKTFSVFRERQGLTENHVQSIMQDKEGQIWFGFSGGVFKLEDKFLRNIKKPGC